jgi:hypothetical protein
MTRKWKLYNAKLYNLSKDPGELNDVSEKHEDLRSNLLKFATKYIRGKNADFSKKRVNLDDALRERLKSLGYLD